MTKLTRKDVQFIKTMANSNSVMLHEKMSYDAIDYLNFRISLILRRYFLEKTTQIDKQISSEFETVGISEDEGKAAIACARRLGIDIY